VGNLGGAPPWATSSCFHGQLGPLYLCDGVPPRPDVTLPDVIAHGPDCYVWFDDPVRQHDLTLPHATRRLSESVQLRVAYGVVPRAWLSALEGGGSGGTEHRHALHGGGSPRPAEAAEPEEAQQFLGMGAALREGWLGEGACELVGEACILRGEGFVESLGCLGGPVVLVPLFSLCEGDERVGMLLRVLAEILAADFSSRQVPCTRATRPSRGGCAVEGRAGRGR
jgi:hypothetical protein